MNKEPTLQDDGSILFEGIDSIDFSEPVSCLNSDAIWTLSKNGKIIRTGRFKEFIGEVLE